MPENTSIIFFDEYKKLDKLCSEMYGINSGGVTCYLNDKKIDMQWSKIGNWREMMIYNLWTYGNGIDWKN